MLLNPALALLLLALSQPMFACVIPVAPDFQDPLAAVNAPPAILGGDPLFGSVVTITSSFTFRFSVTDPNVSDSLYVRWVLDYPPFQSTTFKIDDSRYPPPATGTVHTENPSRTFDCSNGFATITTPQPLDVFVADRPLEQRTADNNNRLDIVETGGYVTRGNWTVLFQCPTASAQAQ
ncbi:MAG TPA: hypothetical protein VHO67_21265 [Polyangia bacterium]|nr:hypothetical protein [Polyangia bacterium]